MTDSEEALAELNRRHDREKKLLREENVKLITELETVSEYEVIRIRTFLNDIYL